MPFTIQCIEPGSRPVQITMDVELDELWAIYMIEDSTAGTIGGLRSTILRRGDEAPPPNSTMLFECKVMQGLEDVKLRTSRVNSLVNVEVIRPDVRSRVTSNMDIPAGARLEVTFEDLRSVAFSLQMAQDIAQSQKLGMGGAQKSRALGTSSSAVWMVPNVASTLRAPAAKITQAIAKRLRKWGFSPYMILTMMSVGALVVGCVVVAYWQYKEAKDAKVRQEELAEIAGKAEASKEAALSAEASCLAERRSLVEALGDVQEERRLLAEEALQISLTQIIAAEIGGSREASDEALAFTEPDKLKELVVEMMVKIRGEIKNPDLCTMYKEALGNDLPEYVLLWHPEEDVACPTEYASIQNGVARIGRWAVSDRVAMEFGEQSEIVGDGAGEGISDLASDPRMKDRWNVLAYTGALRAVQDGMLRAPTGQRPPVAPGQAHLWTLTIFDQYNSMPNPPGGLNKSAERCAMDLVGELAVAEGAAEPGQPVLPDIGKVATGEIELDPTPTAGCPWPADRTMTASAKSAFRSIAQTAVVNDKKRKNEN